MSNPPTRRMRNRMMTNPHAPVFVNEEVVENEMPTVVEVQRRMLAFPEISDAFRFREIWLRRAIVEERWLSVDNLPGNLEAKFHQSGWGEFATNTPDTTVTMNRTIVREYYAILEKRLLFGWTADMGLKLRGVDVRLEADWINTHYGIPHTTLDEDFFSYRSRAVEPREENVYLMYNMARVFGGTHLWPPNEVQRGGVIEMQRSSYPAEWIRIILSFLACRVYGTVHHDTPELHLYLLAYAFVRKQFNVGKYLIDVVHKIACGTHGDGYAYFPFLITALARHYDVPEYDTDDISLATSPLIVDENEHPWFI